MKKSESFVDARPDRCGSWPSKNNRQEPHEGLKPSSSALDRSEFPDHQANRPLSLAGGVKLRDEAVVIRGDDGSRVPATAASLGAKESGDARARPWYAVVNGWREWLESPLYQAAHLEFVNGNGDVSRSVVENSYMERYSRRYYAKIKDLERGVRRKWGEDNVTTAMLTLSSSSLNDADGFRCPADHMREIASGWGVARKQLPHILDGYEWVYARIWEPHASGYGHMHVALFIQDPHREVSASMFGPFMESYTSNTPGAGSEAHSNDPCCLHDQGNGWDDVVGGCDDCRSPVSVNDDVENIGSYISEYLGIFGDDPLERPVSEQMFYATCWATRTRRLDFSNGAQEIVAGEVFRRETGLRPEDRGACRAREESVSDPAETWGVDSICMVSNRGRSYIDALGGTVSTTEIEGDPSLDPPKWVD